MPPRRQRITPPIRTAWLTRNVRNRGARAITDSFTPRRLRRIRNPIAANSTSSLKGSTPSTTAPVHAGGRKLKIASPAAARSEEHTSELQSRLHLVCRLLLEKKKKKKQA